MSGNTERIDELDKKTDIAFADIKEIESKICKVEGRVLELEKPVQMLEQRMDESESYSRRVNLRLYGVPENKDENVRLQTVKICQSVLPEESSWLCQKLISHIGWARKAQPVPVHDPLSSSSLHV